MVDVNFRLVTWLVSGSLNIPDNLGIFRTRIFDRTPSLDESISLEIGFENQNEIAGRNDPAGTALGCHLVGDRDFVIQFLKINNILNCCSYLMIYSFFNNALFTVVQYLKLTC